MNRDVWQGKWHQIKGMLHARWGKFTRDDVEIIRGNQEMLTGRIQERYGCAREEAEKQACDFFSDRDKVRNLREESRISAP